jgi:hypothetical protein
MRDGVSPKWHDVARMFAQCVETGSFYPSTVKNGSYISPPATRGSMPLRRASVF